MNRVEAPLSEHPLLAQLRACAARAGFTCVETQWKGRNAAYTFQCASGHRFTRIAQGLLSRKDRTPGLCLQCQRERVRQRFMATVADKGGVCLEADYLGPLIRHRLRCQYGHEWQPRGSKILVGSWCPACGRDAQAEKLRSRAGSLEALQAKAAAHGGRCLSTEYAGLSPRYEFECAEGHRWKVMGAVVMKGSWCRQCFDMKHSQHMRVRDGMSKIRAAALAKGGMCLAEDEAYRGVDARYRFRCKVGHEWVTKGNAILRGQWCTACHAESQRVGIEKMHAIARERGGSCLSTEYVNANTKLTWECHRGHVWDAIPMSVVKGHWCRSCAFLDRVGPKNQYKRKRYECSGPVER